MGQDYYKILGVDKNANEKEIKSAYRQLSKKWHPDKNQDNDTAHAKFIEIGEAYEVLIDSEKRKIYDQFGADALKNGGGPNGGPGGGNPFNGGGFHDPFDIFDQMFGGHSGRRQRGQNVKRKGPDLVAEHPISLKEFYLGAEYDIEIELNDKCDHCHGSGSEDGKSKKCPNCQGHGVIIQVIQMGMMTQQIQQACPMCSGSGEIIKNPCTVCHGNKIAQKKKQFHLHVPKGIKRDFIDKVPDEGECTPDSEPGDLFFKFTETATNNMGYRRRGNNLYRTEVLTLEESLLGNWQREIPFFDINKNVTIERPANKITFNGEVEVIKNFGMPIANSKKFGDLFIEYLVLTPQNLKADSRIRDEL